MRNIKEFDLYNWYNQLDGKILLSYKGPMDEFIIHSFGRYIKNLSSGASGSMKKLYKIYMELVQNVAFYSYENKTTDGKTIGIGTFVLLKNDNEYFLNIGNMVQNDEITPIIEKCDAINDMDHDELREFKRKEIAKPYSSHGGGNIGLIQVALSSKKSLNYKLTAITEKTSFFAVCVKVLSE